MVLCSRSRRPPRGVGRQLHRCWAVNSQWFASIQRAFLDTNCGKISVSVDGDAPTFHDLYLSEFVGTTANIPLRQALAEGNRTVELTALFDRNPASAGYYLYFDYLWPFEPQDVPDALRNIRMCRWPVDFDTDHG